MSKNKIQTKKRKLSDMRKREICDCGTPLERHQHLYCSSRCNSHVYNRNKKFRKDLDDFIRESNAIEGVYDEDSFKQAKFAYEYLMTQSEMTPFVILKTHKILMLNQSSLMPDEKGYFRKMPVWVGGRQGSDWKSIPTTMKEWCAGIMSTNPTHDWKTMHVLYENIHPFVDGNGRTGRMFMNWHRVKIL